MELYKSDCSTKMLLLVVGLSGFFVFLLFVGPHDLTTQQLSVADEFPEDDEIDIIDSLFNDVDAQVDIQGGSAYTRLTMSIPKTGTSAIEWIAQSIFANFKVEWDKQNPGKESESPVVVNVFKNHSIRFKNKHQVFDVHGKHDSSKVEPNMPLKTHKIALKCAYEKIPAWSDKALKSIPKIDRYLNATRSVFGEDKKYVVMFRDPISTVVSYMYYEYGSKMPREILSSRIRLGNSCAKTSANMALLYRVVTEVLPEAGYQIYPMFFDEMRTKPARFISELSNILGLTINENIIERVLSETSPEHMKQVQQSKQGIGQYSGLSKGGKNSRKVRTAALKGYMTELEPDVLKQCLEDAAFHLPPALRERWGFQ
uniref:Sulfotransferase domain-containing protein n=1 Tax=Aplanochytrium stocchinoi TaxID=215587 RepID=A0A7S3PN90_9STRA|mmetsp:Transcript_1734/g.2609  ORF Transcript_1734/g.2609 Transcript_1734/m.2609 type:complete len:370 (-) Transcript_1734:74-1183(-)|eukprot:CAMPEP_0204827658 /NCGR_PEP_ID=MMETSP1346-20131115/5093_1 /ASSEMBLY_ACC=CAM_ASM_000771 /TAXON_ID=215587 /ORGANISM="Aplanochytrium stocchinoi, Strain GSBS06" /LENGTH=369 /DNA_ID=CAMNT_0051956165 /DNA_START=207 /DNA_END=1316 /DNA_ORIENTATION=-